MKESILEIHKEETKGFSKKPKKIVNKAKRLDALFIAGMLAWPIIHWFIFTGYGDVMMIVKSFQEQTLFKGPRWTFENHINIWNYFIAGKGPEPWNMDTIWRSLSLVPLMFLFALPITFFLAYYIHKKYPLYRTFRIIFMLCSIIGAVVWCLVWKLMCHNQLGILNEILRTLGLEDVIPKNGWLGEERTAWGNIYFFSILTSLGGTNMMYFMAAMNRIPQSLYESAELDGASSMRIFTTIVVPLVWPIYCTLATFSFGIIGSWHMPSMLLTGGNAGTTTIGLLVLTQTKNALDIGMITAFGVWFAVVFGVLITLARKGMQKLYEEVEY